MRLIALTLLVPCIGLTACGSSSEPTEPATTSEPSEAPTETSAVSTDLSEQPVPTVPDGPAAELGVEDIVEGTGPEAKAGDDISVQYVGVSQSTGAEFDSSWSRGSMPFEFALGSGMVIPGWDKGLVGMKAGGRRQLTIPSDLAYGPAGQPPAIGPDETLVFVVDLEKIN